MGNNRRHSAITLLSVSDKVFAMVLLKRISNQRERFQSENHYKYRRGSRTIDAIFIVKVGKEKRTLHFHFIDFKSVFDTE